MATKSFKSRLEALERIESARDDPPYVVSHDDGETWYTPKAAPWYGRLWDGSGGPVPGYFNASPDDWDRDE